MAGVQNIKQFDEDVQERAASKITIHRMYQTTNEGIHNDIAMVKVKKPFILNSYVNTVCLPTVGRFLHSYTTIVWKIFVNNGKYKRVMTS